MNRFTYKVINGLVVFLFYSILIFSGLLFFPSFITMCWFLYKWNMDKFLEFFQAVVITPIVIYIIIEAVRFWRRKTFNYREEGDRTYFFD